MINNSIKSRKGFTLVELMIVVVIMGILVAVAVPVYSAVTKNARTKTCHSNCEVLEKAATQYMANNNLETVEGVAKDRVPFDEDNVIVIASLADVNSKLSEEYLANLDEPLDIFNDGCVYTYYLVSGGKSIHIYCSEHGDKLGAMQP